VRADACKCVKWLARTCVPCHGLFSLPDRWKEEVELLLEERRRILRFFDHHSREWERLAEGEQDWMLPGVRFDNLSICGRIAYAKKQAAQFQRMRTHCIRLWANIAIYVASNGEMPLPKYLVPRHMVYGAEDGDDIDEAEEHGEEGGIDQPETDDPRI